jgi:gliding motility-associated-like protein
MASAGVYTVTVINNATGCDGIATTTVNIIPYVPVPLTNITPTQTINYGSSVQLNADNAVYYWWMPNDGTLNNRNINNPVATPTETTLYTVYGMDSLGCVDSAKILVDVIFDTIYIPSAFTPNGDGLNDIFRPIGMKNQAMVEFSVYNRWGQRVFYTINKNDGWDGTFNGVKQDMDVYNYMLIVALDDGTTQMFKGTVTLVR